MLRFVSYELLHELWVHQSIVEEENDGWWQVFHFDPFIQVQVPSPFFVVENSLIIGSSLEPSGGQGAHEHILPIQHWLVGGIMREPVPPQRVPFRLEDFEDRLLDFKRNVPVHIPGLVLVLRLGRKLGPRDGHGRVHFLAFLHVLCRHCAGLCFTQGVYFLLYSKIGLLLTCQYMGAAPLGDCTKALHPNALPTGVCVPPAVCGILRSAARLVHAHRAVR